MSSNPVRGACGRALLPAITLLAFARDGSATQIVGSAALYRRVALESDPAPGTPAGVVFSDFGGIPGANGDFPPRIDAQGNVVFHAVLSGAGVTGVNLFDGNGLGVWRSTASLTALVARQDEPAPGTPSGLEFMGFTSPLDTRIPLVSAGRAAFLGGLRGPGVDDANALGIWTEDQGGLQLAVRAGAPAPGLASGNTFRLLDVPFLATSGRILFNGLWRKPGDSPSFLSGNQEGFWSNRSGSMQAVILAGNPAPGTAAGVVFRQETSTAIDGAFRDWDSDDALRLVVNGNLGGPGIDDLNDEGMWVEGPAGLVLLAREGDLAPGAGVGVHFGSNNGIDTFGDVIPVRRNAAGTVLFGARLSGPNVPFMRSLWTDRSGSLELVARGTLPVTGSAAGDPAPGFGPGWTFSVLGLVDLDSANRIAFSGFATFQMDFDQQSAGLWAERVGELTLVAKEGDPAPGTAPGVTIAGLNRFVSLADDGHLFFLATFAGTGVDASNDDALYTADPLGELSLILRDGMLFDVSGDGSDRRRIVRILPGDASSAGEVPLELGFADGSSGLFTTRLDGAPRTPRVRPR